MSRKQRRAGQAKTGTRSRRLPGMWASCGDNRLGGICVPYPLSEPMLRSPNLDIDDKLNQEAFFRGAFRRAGS
ncbi:hypothetical protein [Bosea sp. NBC_00550]|uniref:hypothetical protein n=1 Tax=Bosea sp. NBC_00550 TaxID=2969621 RepID=UPI00222E22CD|nr:hypothetical protein [Bosea sp. NBC_00550]UZF93175.1 hypothetical protein NWE53_02875 [Bosea sp. NBC_00550]